MLFECKRGWNPRGMHHSVCWPARSAPFAATLLTLTISATHVSSDNCTGPRTAAEFRVANFANHGYSARVRPGVAFAARNGTVGIVPVDKVEVQVRMHA